MLCPSLCERRIFEHPPERGAAEAGKRAEEQPRPRSAGFLLPTEVWVSPGSVRNRVGFPRPRGFLPRPRNGSHRPRSLPDRHPGESFQIKPSPAGPRLSQPCRDFFFIIIIIISLPSPKNINFFLSLTPARHPGRCGILPLPGRTRYALGWL